MNSSENLAKTYTIEIKIVSPSSVARVMGKRGGRKAVENSFKLLKTNREKMSIFCLSTMFMKKKS